MYRCPTHGTEQPDVCSGCVQDYAAAPAPEQMTAEAKVAEVERWSDVLTIPFKDVHRRIEALAGRPVQTMELGSGGIEALKRELLAK